MCQLHCGLGMEEHLVKNFLDIKLMEINKLVDLNNLRTAPQLSGIQVKKLLKELDVNILNSDWITIGIMATSDNKAIESLQTISRKYPSIKFEISSSNLPLSFTFAEVETLI